MAEDPHQIALGKRLRDLRVASGMSQEDLANAADITPKYLSQLENGHVNPSIGVVRALAEDGLKLSLSALFNFELSRDDAASLAEEVVRLLSGASERDRRKAVAALRAFCSE